MGPPEFKLTAAGCGALLLDAARGPFDWNVQRRIWAVADTLRLVSNIHDVVPGMNNLMIVFDPLRGMPERVESDLRTAWWNATEHTINGREWVVPVTYGGKSGEDLQSLAAHCGLEVTDVVRLHAEAFYTVAAIGALPGLPYLVGLDPRLACKRRTLPRVRVEAGAVIIGGSQTSILPCAAPSGWHIIGHTSLSLFDPTQAPPATLRPGDTVRFTVSAIEPCWKS
jgi:5-oxoprolinase (ATP-hydrolysing) subunit B